MQVEDVDHVYETFTSSYKQAHGKISRSGIPRISKLKDLAQDRRFVLTDVSGNTFYIGTPYLGTGKSVFYRSLESVEYAGHFEKVYDLMYSKEVPAIASNMFVKFFPEDLTSIPVSPIDLAKILLVALDIHFHRNQLISPSIRDQLHKLFNACDLQSPDWQKLHQRYQDIVDVESDI